MYLYPSMRPAGPARLMSLGELVASVRDHSGSDGEAVAKVVHLIKEGRLRLEAAPGIKKCVKVGF